MHPQYIYIVCYNKSDNYIYIFVDFELLSTVRNANPPQYILTWLVEIDLDILIVIMLLDKVLLGQRIMNYELTIM